MAVDQLIGIAISHVALNDNWPVYLRNKSTQRHFLENVLENSDTNHRRLHSAQPCNNTNTRIMLTTTTPISDSVES